MDSVQIDSKKTGGFDKESVKEMVFAFIERIAKNHDMSISVTFGEDSTYVNMYPYGTVAEEESIPIKWLKEKQEEAEHTDGKEALEVAKSIFNVCCLWEKDK